MEREQVDTKNNPNNPNTENKNNKKTLMIIGIILLIIMFIIFIIFITNKDKPSNTIGGTENTQGTEQQSQTGNEDNKETEQQPTEKEVALVKEEYFHTILMNSYEYNEYGELIKKINYDWGEEQEINSIVSYEYDDRGNIVREVEDKDEYVTEYEYVYDEQNRLIAKIEANYNESRQMGPIVKEEYIYDERGNKVKCNIIHISTLENGEINEDLWDGTDYTYDENNNLILKEEYSTGMYEIEEFSKYEYDKNGNIIKEGHYDYMYSENGEPVLIFLYIHEFDENNNEIYFENHSLSANGTYCGKSVETYKYDSNNNLIESNEYSYDAEGEVTHHTQILYTYNEHNHIVKEVKRNGLTDVDTGLTMYTYNYKEDGSYEVFIDMSGSAYVDNTSEEYYDKFGNLTYSKTVYSEGDGVFVKRGQTNIFEIKYETVTVKVRPTKEKE